MPKYYYSSVAAPAKLQGAINDTQTNSIILSASTGLPGSFPFKLTIDPTGTMEIISVKAMSGTTITDCTRGVDGSSRAAHDTGVDVLHDSTAEDFGDPNDHIYGSQSVGTARHAAAAISVTPTGNIASTDLQAALAELDSEKQATSEKGQANGYASLDGTGKVPSSQIPSPTNLLAVVQDTTSVTASIGTSFAAIDATHAKVTFTAPTSGKVLVEVSGGYLDIPGQADIYVALYEGGVQVAGTAPSYAGHNNNTSKTSAVPSLMPTGQAKFYLTGLTAGTSHTYTVYANSNATGGFFAVSSQYPLTITVWSA